MLQTVLTLAPVSEPLLSVVTLATATAMASSTCLLSMMRLTPLVASAPASLKNPCRGFGGCAPNVSLNN